MSKPSSRESYLIRRGELIHAIAEVEAKTRIVSEELLHRRHIAERDDDLKQLRSTHWETAAALEGELQALDAQWRETDMGARLEQAADTLPVRKETIAIIATGLAERARIMRELATKLRPLKCLVADFNEISDQLRAIVKPLRSELGDDVHHLCRALNERHHEARLISGMLFGTGLWGAGSREDWFALQDRDLDSYERMRINTILKAIERALLPEKEED